MGRSTTEEAESERAAQRSRPQITKVKGRCLCGCEEPQPARLQAERGQSSRQRTSSPGTEEPGGKREWRCGGCQGCGWDLPASPQVQSPPASPLNLFINPALISAQHPPCLKSTPPPRASWGQVAIGQVCVFHLECHLDPDR